MLAEIRRAYDEQGMSVASQVSRFVTPALLVLDELTLPMHFGWLDEGEVLSALKNRPSDCNVIVTGRYCPAALIDLADTASDSQILKHAYQQGVLAQRGIES